MYSIKAVLCLIAAVWHLAVRVLQSLTDKFLKALLFGEPFSHQGLLPEVVSRAGLTGGGINGVLQVKGAFI